MRYGIFSDVHANFEALEAVLADMRTLGVGRPVCLGDTVGYNGSPAECLETVRALGCPTVRGNHDHETARPGVPDHFNHMAVQGILYSRSRLDPDQRAYLGALPYQMDLPGEACTLVHATLDKPESWRYVTGPAEAAHSLGWQKTPVAFFGHTHVPHLFVDDGERVAEYFYRKVLLDPAKRYLVNVGSVGQPRDGDWRAAYAVYDSADRSLELRRLPYDIAKAQAKIKKAGLPERLAERLAAAR